MSSSLKNVEALAKALDAEDYDLAGTFLSEDCVYEIRGEVIVGKKKIIASYHENGEAGRKRFDTVAYESKVTALDSTLVRIDYTDIVTRSGDTHVHRCAQEASCGEGGMVLKLVHLDLPGEREALEAFKETHP